MDTAPDKIFAQLQSLLMENRRLKEELRALSQSAREHCERRDKLNQEFKKLTSAINDLKNQRDLLNKTVKELKAKRDATQELIRKSKEKLQALDGEIKKRFSLVPYGKKRVVEEHDRLEWKIQTTPLSQANERQLVKRIGELEAQLLIFKEVDELRSKQRELKGSILEMRRLAQSLHEELISKAKESEEFHQKMKEIVAEASKIKAEADAEHKSWQESRRQVDALRQRYLANLVKVKELDKQIHATSRLKEEDVRKKIEKSAVEKLEKGQKMSLQEFRVLMEKGAI
jgi:uncharacterized coiled-coil DUF342 family protein